METELIDKLAGIKESLVFFVPEFILSTGIVFMLVLGLIFRKSDNKLLFHVFSILILTASFCGILFKWPSHTMPVNLFGGMIRSDDFAAYLKLLFDVAGLLTVLMTCLSIKQQKHLTEYYALIFSVILGAHLLVMSLNFMMVFLSLELISICSYVLTGFAFNKAATEGSLKYFLFGSVASAVMLYGLSIFYGIAGSLDFSSHEFTKQLLENPSPLILIAGLMTLSGFFYKIAAVPMHPWSPDVYEAAPMPIVAFFSVVPKLAGLGILVKFLLALNLFGHSSYDWQLVIGVIAILTLTVGNFSALNQKNPKRMMAYSSIAQSGFLLVGIAAFLPQGTSAMLFYGTVYMLANFLVFIMLQYFESNEIHSIAAYNGLGKVATWPSILILVGLITLTGLPPTAGFTSKLFIFSSLWDGYAQTGKPILLLLVIFGLLNTVIALFYYLRIPYFAFLKSRESFSEVKKPLAQNLLGLILVIVILIFFFLPGLLMGWINKINFVF